MVRFYVSSSSLKNNFRKLQQTNYFNFVVAGANLAAGTGTTSMEALLRSRATVPDPSFSQMKLQFTVDFDSNAPGAMKLHNLILRLRKWIKILEVKTKAFVK